MPDLETRARAGRQRNAIAHALADGPFPSTSNYEDADRVLAALTPPAAPVDVADLVERAKAAARLLGEAYQPYAHAVLEAATALTTLAAERDAARRDAELRRLDCIAEEDCKEQWIGVAYAAEAREQKLREVLHKIANVRPIGGETWQSTCSIMEKMASAALTPVTPVTESGRG